MSIDRSVEERLETLGSSSVPEPDQGFAERLDARLRVAHSQELRGSRWPAIRVPALALTAVVVIAVVGAVIANLPRGDEVVMTVASQTEVYYPDDRLEPGTAGLTLPDGARIVVGADGEAVVDGVVLTPGTEAIVVGDRIEVLATTEDDGNDPERGSENDTEPGGSDDQGGVAGTADDSAAPVTDGDSPTDPTTPTSSSTTTAATPTTVPRTSSSGTAPGRTEVDPTTSEPTRTSTTSGPTTSVERSTTVASTTVPATRAETTDGPSTKPSTTTTTAVPTTDSRAITLTANLVGETRLELQWAVPRGLSPLGWRIKAATGDRVATVVVIRGDRARSATLERAALVGKQLFVEAVGRDGVTVAVSNSLTIR